MTEEQRTELESISTGIRENVKFWPDDPKLNVTISDADTIDAALAEIDRLNAALVYAEAAFRDEGLTIPTRIIRKALEGRD